MQAQGCLPRRPPQTIHSYGGGAPSQVAPFPSLHRRRWRFGALPVACDPSSPRLRLPRARRRAATGVAMPAMAWWVVPAAGVLDGSTPAGVVNVASSPLPSDWAAPASAATAAPLLAMFRRRRRVCDVLAAGAPGRRLRRLPVADTAVSGFAPSPRMSASGSYWRHRGLSKYAGLHCVMSHVRMAAAMPTAIMLQHVFTSRENVAWQRWHCDMPDTFRCTKLRLGPGRCRRKVGCRTNALALMARGGLTLHDAHGASHATHLLHRAAARCRCSSVTCRQRWHRFVVLPTRQTT